MTQKELRELLEKRAKAAADGRAIADKVGAEKRDMSEDEDKQFNAFMDDVDTLSEKIERAERLFKAEKAVGETREKYKEGDEGKPVTKSEEEERKHRQEVFHRFLLRGKDSLNHDEIRLLSTPEKGIETRDMQTGDALHGGSTLIPQQMLTEILKVVDSITAVANDARTFNNVPLSGLGVVTLVDQPTDPDWTPEITPPNKGTGISFGGRELRPHQLTKEELVSNVLLQQSAIDIEGLLQDRIGYKFALAEDNNFLNGDGTQKSLGLMVASAAGIDTSRDVVCGDTSNPTFDGLIDLQSGIKSEYWPKAKFYISRLFMQRLRKIKDGDGNYIWNISTTAGAPNLILGNGYVITDQMPATFTTGQYVCLFGDMSYYWIARTNFAYLQRLNELYAESNRTAFVVRRYLDGMPVQAEAFARGKLA